tara:strand:+ start:6919 stop:7317 length:399 start_codon:yes stop_codon:yes gene_type:complete
MSGKNRTFGKNNQKQVPQKTKPIKLMHIKSPDFNSCFASNFAVTGPLSNGLYQLDCMNEAVDYLSETGTYSSSESNKVTYTLSYEKEDTENVREHVSRIFLSEQALGQLAKIIKVRLENDNNAVTEDDSTED